MVSLEQARRLPGRRDLRLEGNMEFNHNKGRKEVYSRRKCCNGKVRGQRKHGTPGRWSKALKAAGRVRGGSEER